MSELVLIKVGVGPPNPPKSGSPSSEHDMVFIYASTFNPATGTFQDGDLGMVNPPNRNYVKRMLGMCQQEESYERTATVNK